MSVWLELLIVAVAWIAGTPLLVRGLRADDRRRREKVYERTGVDIRLQAKPCNATFGLDGDRRCWLPVEHEGEHEDSWTCEITQFEGF